MAIKYLIKKNLIDDELSEIDFDFRDEWNIDYELEDSEDPNDFHDHKYIVNQYGLADGYPIKIDKVIEQLQKMKNAGCNYVEMDYHCDHIGYQFSGFLIEEATSKQIEEHVKEKIESDNKKKEIQKLEAEIQRLKQK
jgi:hypothetical protein